MIVWIDGRLADTESPDGRISPLDHALLTGDGVFETLKVCDRVPFAITRHLQRLRRSAAALELEPPDDATLRAAMAAVVEANGVDEGRLRLTVTGGAATTLGSDRGDAAPTAIVACGPMRAWPDSTAVVTVPWPRNERGALAGVKSVSYAENVVALAHARRQGAGEAIFGNTVGNLCEGTGTNVFLVLDGELVTPPLSAGPLAGITRELLLEVSGAIERDVPLGALAEADEAFLASSTREVQPIASVDGRPLPSVPGPRSAEAATAFRALVKRNLDP